MARLTKLQRRKWGELRGELVATQDKLAQALADATRFRTDRDHAREERNNALSDLREANEATHRAREHVDRLHGIISQRFAPEKVRELLARCFTPELAPAFAACDTARDFDLVLRTLTVVKTVIADREAAAAKPQPEHPFDEPEITP